MNNLADEVRVYPADDGRITQRKDWLSGEEVEYQYDSLLRLSSSATTGAGGWGQSFGYDGFGNLLSETVTKCARTRELDDLHIRGDVLQVRRRRRGSTIGPAKTRCKD